VKDFVDAFKFMGDNLDLLVNKTVEHLELSGAAIGVALVIALPIGLWLGHMHRGSFIAINVANIGRALPSLAVIAIGLGILGIGFVNVMVALVILAVPPILTNAYLGVDQVDRDTVQAAEGIGMRPWQVFLRVELPISLPLVFAGIRTSAVYVVATATLAAIAGPLKGTALRPTEGLEILAWSDWRARYPESRLVVGADRQRPTAPLPRASRAQRPRQAALPGAGRPDRGYSRAGRE